jgi:PAS domain-containing protein
MDGSSPRKRNTTKPGLRALEACGDGFWELDLKSGSAWFSPWFHQKLNWPKDSRRTTLGELETVLQPAAWTELMARIRAHLEQGRPLALEFEAAVPGAAPRPWWRLQGSALRNDAGQPVHLAGSMREVSADRGQTATDLIGVHGAFDALPVAAALLDARASLLEANREWHAFPGVAPIKPDTPRLENCG